MPVEMIIDHWDPSQKRYLSLAKTSSPSRAIDDDRFLEAGGYVLYEDSLRSATRVEMSYWN